MNSSSLDWGPSRNTCSSVFAIPAFVVIRGENKYNYLIDVYQTCVEKRTSSWPCLGIIASVFSSS